MTYKLIINLNAKKDLEHAIDWYNEQKKNLGDKFLNEFIKRTTQISKNP